MEQETDFFHLVTQHQFMIFVIGSSLIVASLIGLGFILEMGLRKKAILYRTSGRPVPWVE